MRIKILYAFLVLLLCFAFLHLVQKSFTPYYKVLKVNNFGQICIDLNSDMICEDSEYYRLKDVKLYLEDNKEFTKKSNFILKTLLEGKEIKLLEPPSIFYKFARVEINGTDAAIILLKEGFAQPHNKNVPTDYFLYFNKSNFLKNISLYEKTNTEKIIKETEIIEERTPNYIDGAVELYLIDPNLYSLPSKRARTNLAQSIIYNIENAKLSIDAALYGLEGQDEILKALLRARNRGVNVRIVTDSNPCADDTYADTYKLRENFNFKNDNSPFIMHNKFFIFDAQKVLTTSANVSSTGTGGYNSNTGILVNSKVVANVYLKEFEQMFNGSFHKLKTKNELVSFNLDAKTSISIYFAPASDILSPVINEINNAGKEILVSAFYLTHREIIAALIAAKERSVDVTVTIDALGAQKFKDRINMLKQAHIKVKAENWGGKNHQKNILIDSCTFIGGSANFSKNAVIKNDENLYILKNCSIGSVYRKYYFKLYNSIDEKYLFKYPHAEGFESGNSCYDGIDNDFDGKIDMQDENCKK